jgi:hypothetical protein
MADKPAFKSKAAMAEIAKDALERYAKEIFNDTNIQEIVGNAATQGFSRVQIEQKRPLDLSETEQATKYLETLKKSGYGLEWANTHQQKRNGNPVLYKELVIIWGDGKEVHVTNLGNSSSGDALD